VSRLVRSVPIPLRLKMTVPVEACGKPFCGCPRSGGARSLRVHGSGSFHRRFHGFTARVRFAIRGQLLVDPKLFDHSTPGMIRTWSSSPRRRLRRLGHRAVATNKSVRSEIRTAILMLCLSVCADGGRMHDGRCLSVHGRRFVVNTGLCCLNGSLGGGSVK
jgi:hypothetical protein